jgi:Mg2+ and Co2+ transporter CorA
MATATKAAQSGAEKTENAVAQVTETVASTVSKATAVANDIVSKTTDAFTPVVKSAEAKTQELTEAWVAEYRKAEARAQEYAEAFTAEVRKVVVISVDSYQEAVKRYLDLTVEFVDTFKNETVSELTKRNAKAITELVDASVSQARDLLK